GERREGTSISAPNASCADIPSHAPFVVLSRDKGVGSGAVLNDIGLDGAVLEDWASDLGPPSVGGG
ncbi:hypothetical protein A2U01_0102812, partial [Trifolium medium]|nr:hypothetical protein [Trifolium medium]